MARPRRLIAAGTSARSRRRMPAAPSRAPASAASCLRAAVWRAELRAAAVRLLEVVADDLVRRVRLAVEPVGEALVQSERGLLRQVAS